MATAASLLAERGPSGFSLRELCRRAGVSHAAPANHFPSTQALLTAVAADGFERLTAALRDAVDGVESPSEHLQQLGCTFSAFAVEHGGHMAIMFRPDIVDYDEPDFASSWNGAYAEFAVTMALIQKRHNPDLDVGLATTLVWSTMRGLVGSRTSFDASPDPLYRSDELWRQTNDIICLLLKGLRAA